MHSLTLPHLHTRAEVIALSSREWRVSDPTKVERDGRALLGFVERVGDRYEVTPLDDPRNRLIFGSLDQAIIALEARAEESEHGLARIA